MSSHALVSERGDDVRAIEEDAPSAAVPVAAGAEETRRVSQVSASWDECGSWKISVVEREDARIAAAAKAGSVRVLARIGTDRQRANGCKGTDTYEDGECERGCADCQGENGWANVSLDPQSPCESKAAWHLLASLSLVDAAAGVGVGGAGGEGDVVGGFQEGGGVEDRRDVCAGVDVSGEADSRLQGSNEGKGGADDVEGEGWRDQGEAGEA